MGNIKLESLEGKTKFVIKKDGAALLYFEHLNPGKGRVLISLNTDPETFHNATFEDFSGDQLVKTDKGQLRFDIEDHQPPSIVITGFEGSTIRHTNLGPLLDLTQLDTEELSTIVELANGFLKEHNLLAPSAQTSSTSIEVKFNLIKKESFGIT